MKETAVKYRDREVQKYVMNRFIKNMLEKQTRRGRNHTAKVHFKRLMMQRWISAKAKVQDIRQHLLNQNYGSDFENAHKNLTQNMRQSLRVIHGEPLDLEELNSTKDLVMAHDKL
jgi:hypothetical protein